MYETQHKLRTQHWQDHENQQDQQNQQNQLNHQKWQHLQPLHYWKPLWHIYLIILRHLILDLNYDLQIYQALIFITLTTDNWLPENNLPNISFLLIL